MLARARTLATPVVMSLLAFAVVVTAQSGNQPQSGPTVQESNALLGAWRVVSGSYAGQAIPPSQLPIGIRFEGDSRWSDGEGGEGTWATDDTKTPRTLDLIHSAGRTIGKQLCVYEVVGDRLTIAFGIPGGPEADRPTGLTAGAPTAVRFVFERVKKIDSAEPLSTPFDASFAIGSWRNVDPETSGITSATFRVERGELIAHMWGRCHPVDCDWGDTPVDPSSIASDRLAVIWNNKVRGQVFAVEYMRVTPLPNNGLRVFGHRHYTDNSGRQDYDSAFDFRRCEPRTDTDCR